MDKTMEAELKITPEAAEFIRARGGRAVVDLLCWQS